jgi:hypothetical protein
MRVQVGMLHAHVANAIGSQVIAVDKTLSLAPPLLTHPALTSVKADAFGYDPPGPVDWLLCDVLAAPEKSLALLEKWLHAKLCRYTLRTLPSSRITHLQTCVCVRTCLLCVCVLVHACRPSQVVRSDPQVHRDP